LETFLRYGYADCKHSRMLPESYHSQSQKYVLRRT
jgi:hypothetical protein